MDRLSTKGQMIDQIDLRNVAHSGFDRSNHNFGTGKLGALIPVRLDEVYPGDRIKGRPEMVVNFEPLVAPIMGSMVLKQESFFVPYIQLWRNSYRFFTGKNGFDEQMPSVSPRHIFDVYIERVHNYSFASVGNGDDDVHTNDLNGIICCLNHVLTNQGNYSTIYGNTLVKHFENFIAAYTDGMDVFYGSRKMLDLVQPTIDILKRFSESTDFKEFSAALENVSLISNLQKFILEKSSLFGGLMRDLFNFFHGPSSLFDYLGWPVPTDFSCYVLADGQKLVIPEYGVYDMFSYAFYRNILQFGSYPLVEGTQYYSGLRHIFSDVPLVFNPFKAYYLIWYWNYRDQLLETDILDPDGDEFLSTRITEEVILVTTIMRQRCWYKDTFTTALTNTGDGNLLVPTLSETYAGVSFQYYDGDNLVETIDAESAIKAGATVCKVTSDDYEYTIPMNYLRGTFPLTQQLDQRNANYISLDLFDRIKRLRSVVQKRLILGYEVDDVVYSSFMVKMSNVRIHIPEILGRGRDSVVINTVVNNTSTDMQIAGDKTATAYAHGQQSEMNYFSEEWGLFFTITTIMPIQSYAGGMQRLYLKRDPLDYMWPEYATLGMDAVYNTELAAVGTRLTDEQGLQVFGYQGRYYDLKSRQDEEHGRLLTDLNYLTFSREWDKNNPPRLNYIFVHCWPRLDGFVIDSPDVDVFRYDCYNAHAWERRLPVPSEYVGA